MTLAHGLGLLAFAALLTAGGQLCFKLVARLDRPYRRKLLHPVFWMGGGFFICGPVLASLAAQVVDFSVLYGMTSLNFLFVLLLCRLFLGERIDWPKGAGVCVIVAGLLILVTG